MALLPRYDSSSARFASPSGSACAARSIAASILESTRDTKKDATDTMSPIGSSRDAAEPREVRVHHLLVATARRSGSR